MIDPESAVLSVRGNVLENGMPRFFRRLAEGMFDEEDLIYQTQEFHRFLDDAAKEYQFDRNNIVAIGYSNGANIAASLLFLMNDSLKGAILHHPMVPIRGIPLPNLTGTDVFIGAGTNDTRIGGTSRIVGGGRGICGDPLGKLRTPIDNHRG